MNEFKLIIILITQLLPENFKNPRFPCHYGKKLHRKPCSQIKIKCVRYNICTFRINIWVVNIITEPHETPSH